MEIRCLTPVAPNWLKASWLNSVPQVSDTEFPLGLASGFGVGFVVLSPEVLKADVGVLLGG